jgi:hypothetical protein
MTLSDGRVARLPARKHTAAAAAAATSALDMAERIVRLTAGHGTSCSSTGAVARKRN